MSTPIEPVLTRGELRDGWKVHDPEHLQNNVRPVSPGTKVRILRRDGRRGGVQDALCYFWGRTSNREFDIVAYRVVKEETPTPAPRSIQSIGGTIKMDGLDVDALHLAITGRHRKSLTTRLGAPARIEPHRASLRRGELFTVTDAVDAEAVAKAINSVHLMQGDSLVLTCFKLHDGFNLSAAGVQSTDKATPHLATPARSRLTDAERRDGWQDAVGVMPVPGDVMVFVKLREGESFLPQPAPAEEWYWKHDEPRASDIIAYKVSQPKPTTRPKPPAYRYCYKYLHSGIGDNWVTHSFATKEARDAALATEPQRFGMVKYRVKVEA